MKKGRSSILVIRWLTDAFVLNASFLATFWLTSGSLNNFSDKDFYLLFSLTLMWALTGNITRLYDEFRLSSFSYEMILLIKNIAYNLVALVVFLFLLKLTTYHRMFIIYDGSIFLAFTFLEKYLIRKGIIYFRKKGRNTRTMLIVGAGKNGRSFGNSVIKNPHFGYKVLGYLDEFKPADMNGEYLGEIGKLDSILAEKNIDDVVVALPSNKFKKIDDVIGVCENYTTRIKIIPDYLRFATDKYSVSMVGDFPLISVTSERINELPNRVTKRLFDIAVSGLVILTILPWLSLVIFIIQKVTDPGPMVYKGIRWGRNSKPFICFKFRSMKVVSKNISTDGTHQYTKKDDERITKLGKFLRRSNLDEFPQFFNVFIGDMSIVGPRPHDEKENLEIKNKIDMYMWRHLVKPGITGWAQVNGYRGGTKDMNLMEKRTQHDLWYIEKWNFLLDLEIIFLTVWRMIKGDPNAY